MNIQLNYGTAVATVPAAALAVMDRATRQDLAVLLTLAADPALLGGASGECAGIIAARLGCPASQIETSLSFWRGARVLTVTEESERIAPAAPSLPEEKPTPAPESSKEEPKETRPARPRPAAELPRYTSAELADLLEARKDVNDFLRECQNVWGEMFNTHQTNTILGFVDYLGLEWDYILALLAFGVREQDKRGVKRSLRYVEKMAFDFYDEGITDLPALQEKICSLEKTAEVEGSLRRMFGMGERALTPTEKKKFSTWLYEYQYDLDIITRAFEVTVDAKGSPNLKYMDAVLANWNRDGLRTLADIENSEASFQARKAEKAGKKPAPDGQGSFNTEDFFAAAVRRSFGDDFDPDKKDA